MGLPGKADVRIPQRRSKVDQVVERINREPSASLLPPPPCFHPHTHPRILCHQRHNRRNNQTRLTYNSTLRRQRPYPRSSSTSTLTPTTFPSTRDTTSLHRQITGTHLDPPAQSVCGTRRAYAVFWYLSLRRSRTGDFYGTFTCVCVCKYLVNQESDIFVIVYGNCVTTHWCWTR